jgi:transposase-like protein
MKPPPDPHYRHRFPAEIISHAVWLYHVFSLSLRDVELILAERGTRLPRNGATLVHEIRRDFRRSPATPPATTRGQVAPRRCVTNTFLK